MSRTNLFLAWGRPGFCATLLLFTLIFLGCAGGESKRATAPVSGKVTYNGMPVTGGSLMFSPMTSPGQKEPPGKSAVGNVESDGSFTLTTYEKGDGAIVGKHQVAYGAPGPPPIDEKEHSENSKPPALSPFYGLMPKVAEVEVKAGENKFDIELVPDPKIPRPAQ